MIDLNDVKSLGDERAAASFTESVYGASCIFVCVISYTETCEIPGITVAGAGKELIKYTPAADAEFLYYGRCKCIDAVPATPDGKPTPALLTRAALRSAEIPVVVVDAGSKIKPDLPYASLGLEHGKNIATGRALEVPLVKKAYEDGLELGRLLGRTMKHVVIGESIPAGTTTALGTLLAMGIDARYKVSSSMPENPHELKVATVEQGMKAAGIEPGSLAGKPFEAVSHLGDPMIPSVAGIAVGASSNSRVMLAGGTQMAAVVAFIDAVERSALERMAVGTTKYIAEDRTSDIQRLITSASSVRMSVLFCDPRLERSTKAGLRAYANGFVKEGVGAGGACIAAMLKTKGNIDSNKLLEAIEAEYVLAIETSS